MQENIALAKARIGADRISLGILFGLLAGLGFTLALWGYEVILLSNASAELPWLKFAIGAPACLLISILAGWLTARFDNSLLGFIIWGLSGLGFVWIASHTPFEGLTLVLTRLEPVFQGFDLYPFVLSARARMQLLYIIAGLLTGLAGSFELFLIESALRSAYFFARLFTFLIFLVILAPIGLAIDNLINQPLREPILVIDDLIQTGLKAEITPVTKDEARQLGLSAIKTFGSLIHQPYQINLGRYDPESLSETSVHINFNGTWGTCFVLDNRPMYCQLSRDLYLKRFACTLDSSLRKSCLVKIEPEADEELDELAQALGGPPVIQTIDQRGAIILLAVTGSSGQKYQCALEIAGNIYFNSCKPLTAPIEITGESTSTPSPSATPAVNLQPTLADSPVSALISPQEVDHPALQDAPRYAITLTIDYSGHALEGLTQVDYVNTENTALDSLYFRLLPNGQGSYGNGSLTVKTVVVNGQAVQTSLSVYDTVLKVDLPARLEPGQAAEINLEFAGQVPLDFGGDITPAGYGIYNLSNGVMALSGWYPTLAVYDQDGWNLDAPSEIGDSGFSDMAFYSVDVTAPSSLVLAATGTQTGMEILIGKRQYHFESGPARDFFLIASPDFEVASRTVDGTTVHSYYLRGQEAAGRTVLQVASDSLKVFNQLFGAYPYAEFDVVQAPMRNALGVEFPGIVLIGAEQYAGFDRSDFHTTIAHEVAHQWWYNLVGNDVFDEPWLDESLTTYVSSFYFEFGPARSVPQPLIQYWQERYDKLRQDGLDEQITATLAHFESLNNPRIYGGVAYSKGALFFNALRQEIGDQAFFQALKDYYLAYQYRIARGQDLLDIFEQAAGRDLDDFYNQWLYTRSAP